MTERFTLRRIRFERNHKVKIILIYLIVLRNETIIIKNKDKFHGTTKNINFLNIN